MGVRKIKLKEKEKAGITRFETFCNTESLLCQKLSVGVNPFSNGKWTRTVLRLQVYWLPTTLYKVSSHSPIHKFSYMGGCVVSSKFGVMTICTQMEQHRNAKLSLHNKTSVRVKIHPFISPNKHSFHIWHSKKLAFMLLNKIMVQNDYFYTSEHKSGEK